MLFTFESVEGVSSMLKVSHFCFVFVRYFDMLTVDIFVLVYFVLEKFARVWHCMFLQHLLLPGLSRSEGERQHDL